MNVREWVAWWEASAPLERWRIFLGVLAAGLIAEGLSEVMFAWGWTSPSAWGGALGAVAGGAFLWRATGPNGRRAAGERRAEK